MSYIVTARKWRPLLYDDVVGQNHITTTLRNAVATNRISHAYIFSGPRGVGKTTTARILAKAANCLHPVDHNPDNTCELCTEITENRSVNVFEIDGASNRGVDEIRNLRESVRYAPAKGKFKVYIIDEVHMLTKEAFNALLKTLEEPPPHTIFILATTEIHKVPATILSRCQRFDFHRIPVEAIVARLRHIASNEKISADEDALHIIARRADGSMRDAQSIFDQVVSFSGDSFTARQIVNLLNLVDEDFFFKTAEFVAAKDVRGTLLLIDELMIGGADAREFLIGLTEHFRHLLVCRATGSTDLIEASDATRKKYLEQASRFSENDILRLMRICSETELAVRLAAQPRLRLETGLLQMVKMDKSVQIDELLQQLGDLKKRLAGDVHPPAGENEHPTEAPLRGSVSASTPHLRPGQSVAPPPVQIPVERLKDFTSSHLPDFSVTGTPLFQNMPTISLSPDDAMSKWPVFVEEARKEKIALGTMLGSMRVINVEQNRLRIGCPDDFHLDQLQRHRQFLGELAKKVYGTKVFLESTLTSATPSTLLTPVRPAATAWTLRDHPIVKALVREFAAIELE